MGFLIYKVFNDLHTTYYFGSMSRSNFLTCLVSIRTVSIYTAVVMIVLIILDLLATRQILYFDNTSEIILFTLTVVIGYGVGSWILLEYTRQITANLRSKSLLVNTTHWIVTIIQFSILVKYNIK